MGRIHAFEFLDMDWYPRVLNDGARAYLHRLEQVTSIGEKLAPSVNEVLERNGLKRVVDLGSGSGGPALLVHRAIGSEDLTTVLTDLRPDVATLEQRAQENRGIEIESAPTNASDVPERLVGLRTLYNALHHFKPTVAREVLRDAAEKRQPILVAELGERTLPNLLSAPLIVPLLVLLLMPTVRPLRWLWLFFTYLLPLLPLTIAWDGLVSHLRVYSPKELLELAPATDGYKWEVKHVALAPGARVTMLIGQPTD